jgi:hypothetical protein
MQRRRLTWLIGGIGLVACGVFGVVRGSVLGFPATSSGLALLTDALWAAAILILAIGLNYEGSVVARKPLGLTASAAVALWPITARLVNLLADPVSLEQVDDWRLWYYLSMVLPLMFGVIAAMQVARTRVVTAPWNWAPLWVLCVQTAIWVLPQVIGAAAPDVLVEMYGLIAAFGTLGFLAATLGLGILAIVLSSRTRQGTVPVFPSSTTD